MNPRGTPYDRDIDDINGLVPEWEREARVSIFVLFLAYGEISSLEFAATERVKSDTAAGVVYILLQFVVSPIIPLGIIEEPADLLDVLAENHIYLEDKVIGRTGRGRISAMNAYIQAVRWNDDRIGS